MNDDARPIGTCIEVTELTKDAARQFALDSFRTRVENEIKQKHSFFIARGFVVRVCGHAIPRDEWQLMFDHDFKPAYHEKTYTRESQKCVKARIYVGVGRSSPSDAGWYVICNGRLILHADKSEITGWGVGESEETGPVGVPRYHNQFSRFRGYALFDSEYADSLPWNSMKTYIDLDDPVWLDAKDTMVSAMRPVIDFLNSVDKETQLPEDERPLTVALRSTALRPISEIREQRSFVYPTNLKKARPSMINIHFQK